MRSVLALFLAVASASIVGCFDPSIGETTCAVDLRCPPKHFCDPTTLTCKQTGGAGDGGVDANGDGATANVTPFCRDADIALCLEFSDTIDDGSAHRRAVTSSATPRFGGGMFGRNLELDGTYLLSVDGYRDMSIGETIEFWMTVAPTNQTQTVIRSTTEILIATTGGEIVVSSVDIVVGSMPLTSSPHHVAVRISGNTFALYVDGSERGSGSFVDGSSEPAMTIGGAAASPFYAGRFDQLRVWERALDADEIASIADATP